MKSIKSDIYDGKVRTLYAKECKVCQAEFYLPLNQLSKQFCCSRKCSGVAKQRRLVVICGTCERLFEMPVNKTRNSKSGLHFCSRGCKDKAQRLEGRKEIHPSHYGTASNHKALLIRQRGKKCQQCGLTEWLGVPIPLTLDHIDGDAYNDDESNLRLVCSNCDSISPTFRGRNRGKGRKSRVLMGL